MKVSVPGYAKINLFLDIRSLRENGYHNILSIMQRIGLHDTITVTYSKDSTKSISLSCDRSDIPCDSKNLAYRAADIYPISGKLDIHIEKHIPMSAGLAGGSADAAATLIALNLIAEKPLSTEELCTLGAKLGADVPFCIKGGACLVEGIGEIMTPIAPMPNLPLVIAKMGEGMSTPAAYRALDIKFNNFVSYPTHSHQCQTVLDANDATTLCEGLFNVFEEVVEPDRPCVTEIKKTMLSKGAVGAMMSGSGTSVFGIFQTEAEAHDAKKALSELGAEAFVCYPA